MRVNMIKKRKHLGLTQEEVAKKVGIARTTYTNIELGDKNPSLAVALKIKKVLKTEDDDIFLISNVPEGNDNQSA
ncbi:helix-turn-helix transcriptional regulator [Clostridium sp. Cult1]|uniref:helix-turn-helix transcriptional regulator n=1 Tax=Clostridium sp. Cult1 TaxID=2079002 RepID=UPI001F2FBC9C|nr:helix-turn-helix domain-containing protein [Clostridium sp. Cult1]MCF6464166.1 transcriptional regulator [Clostridium sp. Cult1]